MISVKYMFWENLVENFGKLLHFILRVGFKQIGLNSYKGSSNRLVWQNLSISDWSKRFSSNRLVWSFVNGLQTDWFGQIIVLSKSWAKTWASFSTKFSGIYRFLFAVKILLVMFKRVGFKQIGSKSCKGSSNGLVWLLKVITKTADDVMVNDNRNIISHKRCESM